MRKSRLYPVLAFAALIGAFGAACSDNGSDEPPVPPPSPIGTPTAVLSDKYTATQNSVTFEITVADADKAAWMIREKTVEAPTAAQVLSDGAKLEGTSPYTRTATGLNAGTAYVLYAAAAKEDVVGAVASLEVTTSAPVVYERMLTLTDVGKNTVSYHIEVAGTASYRHFATSKTGFDSFRIFMEEKQAALQVLQLYGSVATGSADYTASDLALKANGQPNDIIAGEEYVLLCCDTDEAGMPNGDYQIVACTLEQPDILDKTVQVEVLSVTYDEASVRCTPDAGIAYIFHHLFLKGDVATLLEQGGEAALKTKLLTNVNSRVFEFAQPREWMYLQPGSDYVACTLGIDADGNHTPLIKTDLATLTPDKVDTENLVFTQSIQAEYYGQSGEGYNFYFILADQTMSRDEYGDWNPDRFPCNSISCDLYSAAGEGLKLPAGVYSYGANGVPGTWHPDYSWAANFSQTEYRTDFGFEDGTITVSHEGDNYRIVVNLVTEEGQSYTGTYVGPIVFEDASTSQASVRRKASRVVK